MNTNYNYINTKEATGNRQKSWIAAALSTTTGGGVVSTTTSLTASAAMRRPVELSRTKIDSDAAEQHLQTLLHRWLAEVQIPIQPWSGILLNIVLQQIMAATAVVDDTTITHVDTSQGLYHRNHHHPNPTAAITTKTTTTSSILEGGDFGHKEKKNGLSRALDRSSPSSATALWIQCIPNGKPEQSQFLPNIYKGVPLSNVLSHVDDGRWWHVGGTIELQGLVSPSSYNYMSDLICALMHVLGNMHLETSLWRDHHLTPPQQQQKNRRKKRIPSPTIVAPPPSPRRRMNEPPTVVSMTTAHNTRKSTTQSNTAAKPVALIKWVFSRSKWTSSKPKQSKQMQHRPVLLQHSPTATANTSSTNVSLLFSSKEPSLPPAPRIARNICNQLTTTHVSSSIGRMYSLPRILIHLRDFEENEQKALDKAKEYSSYSKPSSLLRFPSMLSRTSSLRRRGGPSMLRGRQLQQQQQLFVVGSNYYTNVQLLNLERLLLIDTTPPSLLGFIRQQHISFTYSFYPKNMKRKQQQPHQKRPCVGPNIARMDYYRYKADPNLHISRQFLDQSLGLTIIHMSQQATQSCWEWIKQSKQNDPSRKSKRKSLIIIPNNNNIDYLHQHGERRYNSSNEEEDENGEDEEEEDGGCELPMTDHILRFSHGPSRVYIDMNTTTTMILPNTIARTAPEDGTVIMMWSKCTVCKAETKPTPMTHATFCFSFAKYLEIMLYEKGSNTMPSFRSRSDDSNSNSGTCKHNIKLSDVVYCFYYDHCTLQIRRDEHPIKYTLCTPNIPAMTNTATTTTSPSSPSVPTSTNAFDSSGELNHEIDLFFTAIIRHLELIDHYLKGEAKQEQLSAAEKSDIETQHKELKALKRTAHNDYSDWMLYIADNSSKKHQLNDVRRAFVVQAKFMLDQLTEWQRDRCPELIAECGWDIPDYFNSADKRVHAMPDSSILVREDEPTSIISYTLNCAAYQSEILQKEIKSRAVIDNSSIVSLPATTAGGHLNSDDDDYDDQQQHGPLAGSSISTSNTTNDFYFSSLERYYLENQNNINSSNADILATTTQQQPPASTFATARQTLIQHVQERHISQHPHLGKLKAHWRARFQHHASATTVPSPWKHLYHHRLRHHYSQQETPPAPFLPQDDGEANPISWEMQEERTIAHHVNKDTHSKEIIKEIRFHKTIATATTEDNSRQNRKLSPHIRHRFVHNNIEFTCVVYYAQEFEELRKRCGIDQVIIESLCRCQTWKATGDDRLVIKEMISSWNLAEKQQFLEFAPAYFDYMKRTAEEVPSVLTKIFGFYTIRMTDSQKRTTWAMDVMVMDHLFYNRTITQRFDFKGVSDRQVEKQEQQQLTTLWDGDWIHGYRLGLTTTQYSKALIIDIALRNDTEFIEKCNIMDYSLLVGIDEQNKEIVVGLVDFIGAYTWYKKIESKSKATLKPQKQVTVLPPQQYRARFCREISNYFVSVPGKFDRVEPKEERNSFVASFCGVYMDL
ncbi:hypothetical protein BDB00DRAFT_872055 [Zychaea mexicana]|uniref:uncharacterized protein n=1 Tax=Zychaea mexicana TaxID=64656 RepID=UPI0022FE2958|nr:uncharacterized protein BDB00DRAFT_872055 [Zychaea mexicana]KAI9493812.1 hypothetical protein BDB00DRAFT_872055 [Zychaea mexicana]